MMSLSTRGNLIAVAAWSGLWTVTVWLRSKKRGLGSHETDDIKQMKGGRLDNENPGRTLRLGVYMICAKEIPRTLFQP